MRLHLHILRNALPPVQIVFTTGTGPSSHTRESDCTVADLLADVNHIVPLESSDGEWGLEDYVVEVAPASSPSTALVGYGGGTGRVGARRGQTPGGAGGYECLHYAAIEAVLREDDEVTIRPLSSEELRVRRLGGRHQITGDGRHLIDGVSFGRRWLRAGTARPGILIPPRKRRRMITAEDEESDEDFRQILPPNWAGNGRDDGALVSLTGYDEVEDDDGDDDYDYEESDDDEMEGNEQSDSDEAGEENHLQIAIRQDFDDADADAESTEDELQGWDQDVEEQDESLLTDNDDLSEEVKLILRNAEQAARAGGGFASRKVLQRTLKRKRDVDDEDGYRYDDDTFEGFSSPQKGHKKKALEVEDDTDSVTSSSGSDTSSSDSESDDTETRSSPALAPNSNGADANSESQSESSSSGADDDNISKDIAMEEAKKRVLALMSGFGKEEPSEAGEDESSAQMKVNEHEDTGLFDDDETSSSGEDSTDTQTSDSEDGSDSESETSDSECENDKEVDERKRRRVSAKQARPTETLKSIQLTGEHPEVSPGQGLSRTHRNNERAKRRRKLAYLKASGVLPPEADFKALAEYENAQNKSSTVAQADAAASEVPGPVIATVNEVVAITGTVEPVVNAVSLHDTTEAEVVRDDATTETPRPIQRDEPEPEPTVQSTSKRARLDLASSRRMLFSSLGLRTPKTKEAEQALREKLSNSARPATRVAGSTKEASPSSHTITEDWDSWRDKLVVSAVECEGEGGLLEPPPFPFQQGWMRRNGNNNNNNRKRKLRDQDHYYHDRNDQSQDNNEMADNPVVTTLNYDDEPKQVPTEASSELKTIQQISAKMCDNFENLPALQKDDAVPGAIIAYKELHVDASTNWQPEISSYRVGEITQADPYGTIQLKLDPSSRETGSRTAIDDVEGQKKHGFEITDNEAEEADDGSREVQFSDLISAKLVKASAVEVPESSLMNKVGLHGGDCSLSSNDEPFAVVPESAERGVDTQESEGHQITVEIDTPRRQEITAMIRDAGFDSALDDQILAPMRTLDQQLRASQSPVGESSAAPDENSHGHRKRSPGLDFVSSGNRRSSELGGEPSVALADNANPSSEPDMAPASSSPFIHTQETVEYPHISQMDIGSSGGAPKNNNSSSHQDAQKLSPAPALESFSSFEQSKVENAVDNAVNASEEGGFNDKYESSVGVQESVAPNSQDEGESDNSGGRSGPSQRASTSESLGSEVPQSQSQSQPQQQSFLGGTGHDGHDSSYHDGSDDAYSSDDLPSLSEITSSQISRRGPPPAIKKTTRSSLRTSSPVQTRKSLRTAAAVVNGRSYQKSKPTPPPQGGSSSPAAPEQPAASPSPSEDELKLSQSREPRMSQIPPTATPIVDLTVESEVSGPPQKSHRQGGDYDDGGELHENESSRVKRKEFPTINGHGRHSPGATNKTAGRKSSSSGVGNRRFLTTKKRNYF
ncbi:uncharacterized protein PV06_07729 [Exophiala oligosperma]|uniref:Uncharacterized protein n=1 Tax=Exophiala oligosperma TaxID=215243 RepID=A0A0D2DBU6_9EURO|nr:uncharacterized protein PV06_07729 [Exophiala oligosperma]KIW40543.1 hypothetical protein PV06_07729 [Exophiala oligosperma]